MPAGSAQCNASWVRTTKVGWEFSMRGQNHGSRRSATFEFKLAAKAQN